MITCFFYAYLRPGNNSIPLKTCPYNPGQFLVFKNKMCVKNECVERLNERHFSLLFVTLKLMPRRHWTGPGCSNVGRSCHWRIETVRGDLRKKKVLWTLWVSVWSKHKGSLGPKPFPFIRQWLLFWQYIYECILWLSSSLTQNHDNRKCGFLRSIFGRKMNV